MDEILKAIVTSLTGSSQSIFSDEEKKVIALANLAHNSAVATKKMRPQFASSVVKDIAQFERMGGGTDKTITVRKLSFGVGVERIFPVHAPIVDSIEVTRKGKVRRSKLYYLRERVGKSAKIKEDRN